MKINIINNELLLGTFILLLVILFIITFLRLLDILESDKFDDQIFHHYKI